MAESVTMTLGLSRQYFVVCAAVCVDNHADGTDGTDERIQTQTSA